jgi:hypothetical protein
MTARLAAAPGVKVPPRSLGAVPQVATCGQPTGVTDLLLEFATVVNEDKALPAATHDVLHHITTTGPPLKAKFRRLDGEKLAAAQAEFASLERDGIVRRSDSPWASPLHMVRKKDGSWRPCGDFRRLNLVTVPDSYPVPNMLDVATKMAGCRVFSKVDLRKGYHQIPVHPPDIPKTAITTPFGLFEYLRMPFGLRNAGNTFQRMMDRILSGLDFCFWYLDDIITASPSSEQHLAHLRLLFQRLQEHGLVINLEKMCFFRQLCGVLGPRDFCFRCPPPSQPCAGHRGFPAAWHFQAAAGLFGACQFLSSVCAPSCPHPQAVDGHPPWWPHRKQACAVVADLGDGL